MRVHESTTLCGVKGTLLHATGSGPSCREGCVDTLTEALFASFNEGGLGRSIEVRSPSN